MKINRDTDILWVVQGHTTLLSEKKKHAKKICEPAVNQSLNLYEAGVEGTIPLCSMVVHHTQRQYKQ